MTTDDALFFIDANKYLDLYRTKTGRLSLAGIHEQADHIFVTQKVVDEVRRNTIKETANFLTNRFDELPLVNANVPDQLFGATKDQSKNIKRQVEDIRRMIQQVNTELRTLKMDIMKKVAQSTDEVSTALAPIFAKAVRHSDRQLQRAKARKERGDPPGKTNNPIGDQLTWEQILCRFVGKTKLWIVTKDSDYGSMYGKKPGEGFVNRLLYDELRKVSPGAEAFLFENVPDAIEHFAHRGKGGSIADAGATRRNQDRRRGSDAPTTCFYTHRCGVRIVQAKGCIHSRNQPWWLWSIFPTGRRFIGTSGKHISIGSGRLFNILRFCAVAVPPSKPHKVISGKPPPEPRILDWLHRFLAVPETISSTSGPRRSSRAGGCPAYPRAIEVKYKRSTVLP